jgi:pyruvate/2-oxoglutarate dehydrogenase complex dihydrolipoamide dehydrogenase (E3) component
MQDILVGAAKFVDNHTIKYGLPGRVDVGGQVTAKDVIIATGSVPFVPPGACGRKPTAAAAAVAVAVAAGEDGPRVARGCLSAAVSLLVKQARLECDLC